MTPFIRQCESRIGYAFDEINRCEHALLSAHEGSPEWYKLVDSLCNAEEYAEELQCARRAAMSALGCEIECMLREVNV